VGIVNQPIKDGIGEGRIPIMPCQMLMGSWLVTIVATVAFVDDIHQVAPLWCGQLLGAPIV
jgi:hypothetical protein